ncbi:MAG: CBS domain-containing protein [Thermodesulfobacteriota bacterium]|nr:CBS domain-containing protein [Thermodesulfobacteriota bacterium]
MEKRVKDVMNPIEEYDTVDVDAQLCDAFAILKRNHEGAKKDGTYHKTLFVTDASKVIVGKISIYDLIRGLVPENAKRPEVFSARAISSRALEVAEQVGAFQERFKWLQSTFVDLVKQEAHKKVGDIMSQVHPVLKEDDQMNLAIYILFKEGVRQQLVERDGQIVGVINLMVLLNEFLETVGPECYVEWEK